MEITTKQVAQMLNLTRQQVSGLVRNGKLKATRINDNRKYPFYKFNIDDIYIFIEEKNKTITEKVCTICKTLKPIDNFNIDKNAKDGHKSQCRICTSENNKKYSLKSRERILEYQRKWYQENKESKRLRYLENRENILNKRKKQYQKNKEKIRIKRNNRYNNDTEYRENVLKETTTYREKNRKKINKSMREYHKSERGKEYAKKYRDRDYVKIKAKKRNKEYYENNTEKMKQQTIDWGNKNPDKVSFYEAKRRAKKKGQSIEGVPIKRNEIIERDKGICYICGKGPLENIDIHLDHVVPLSKGGLHTPENIKVACVSCNCKKQEKTIDEVIFLIENNLW